MDIRTEEPVLRKFLFIILILLMGCMGSRPDHYLRISGRAFWYAAVPDGSIQGFGDAYIDIPDHWNYCVSVWYMSTHPPTDTIWNADRTEIIEIRIYPRPPDIIAELVIEEKSIGGADITVVDRANINLDRKNASLCY